MVFCCSNVTYVAPIKTRLLLNQYYKAVGTTIERFAVLNTRELRINVLINLLSK